MRKSPKILNYLLFLSLVLSVVFRPVMVWADQSSSKVRVPASRTSCPESHAYLQKEVPASYLSAHISTLKIVPKEESKEIGLAPAASKIRLPLNDSLGRFSVVHFCQSFSPRNFLVLRI